MRFVLLMFLLAFQNSPTTGTFSGVVRDSSGGVVPGVVLSLRSIATNQIRRVTSADDGSYRFAALAVGDYEFRVEAAGFGPYVNPTVTIALGSTSLLDITLRPAGVSADVAVTSQPPPLDPTATATATTIDPERIEELPVNSRNYLEFTLLAPGVSSSNPQSSPAAADSGFTFGGLRPRSNSIAIDGLDNTDETTGAARVALSPEIIHEFQIVNNGISAESGGAAGGAINVVTKTGTNVFHGDSFFFAQNEVFNASEEVAGRGGPGRPLFHRYQPGVSVGGPILGDRLFFYTAGEQEHRLADSASEIFSNVRRFRTGSDETEAAGKLTYLTARHTLNSRFAFTNLRERGDAFNTEEFNDVSSRGSAYTKDYQWTGSDMTVLSSAAINELRFQGSTRRAQTNAGDRIGPEIDIVGQARFGRTYDAETSRRESRGQFIDDLTVERGHHELKAGVTINGVRLRSELSDGFGGIYIFRTLADFNAGRAAEWRQAFGTPRTEFGVVSAGAFFQDRYQMPRHLTLNAGARYDVEVLPPGAFRTRYDNVSPRVGLAWNPSGGWVFRGGAGFYFDRIPLAFVNRAIQKDGVHAFEQTAYDVPFPSVSSPAAGVPVSIFRADPAFATPYSIQTNAGIERLISKDVTFRADYLMTRGIHLLRTRIYQLESSASSTYHGLTLSLNKRLSDEFELLSAYTFSKTLDDASDYDEQPQNPDNLRADRALSRQDVRNRLVVNALFDLPIGDDENDRGKAASQEDLLTRVFGHIEAAPIFTLSSGRPVNVLTGTDDEHTGAYPLSSRPIGFGRNTASTPAFVNMDMRIVKYIPYGDVRRLDFTAEAFNMFNHPNVTSINPFYGIGPSALPGFGKPTGFAAPRQLRFSIDFEF